MNWKLIHQIIDEHDATDVVETMEHVSFNVRIEPNSAEQDELFEELDYVNGDVEIEATGETDLQGYKPYNITITHPDAEDYEDYQIYLRKLSVQ